VPQANINSLSGTHFRIHILYMAWDILNFQSLDACQIRRQCRFSI